MATLEDEIRDLKEKNNELAQKVQHWKMTAAERENEKLNLMKEMNELRLKYSRLKNTGGHEARKLDNSLQQASEKAISHLVKASAEIARSMEIAKAYMRDRQEMEVQSPRWSTLGGTPTTKRTDKVHRVPPMMMGGQSIQPVVALSRTLLNSSNPVAASRSPTQNRSMTERAVPMHMLQDVYIPLTRIDISDLPNNNMETETEANNADDSTEDLGLEDSEERIDDESANISDEDDEYSGRKLHALSEEDSEIEEDETPRLTLHLDNPLEGPSWLLDSPPDQRLSHPRSRANLEPDSTTDPNNTPKTCSAQKIDDNAQDSGGVSVRVSCAFSPTVRRRKRTSSPPATPRQHHYSPRPASSRKNATNGRVLKVLVAKMRLESELETSTSPPKRARSPPDALLTFDAPSPNGATDSAVIVSEARGQRDHEIQSQTGSPRNLHDSLIAHRSRHNSQDSRNSHMRLSQESRTSHRRLSQEGHTSHRRLSQEGHTSHRRLSQEGHTSHARHNQETHEPRSRPYDDDSRRMTQDSVVKGRGLSEQRSRLGSVDSRDSDSGSGGQGDSISEGRTRRPRKMITYKEKPLNRKLRR